MRLGYFFFLLSNDEYMYKTKFKQNILTKFNDEKILKIELIIAN
jgi:hypothetical protein